MNRPAFIYAAYPPAATVTATSTASGLTAADVLESTEDTGWRPATIAGAQSLTIDLGDSLPIGCVALAGEYLNGITLEVRASSDNFGGVDIQISPPAALAQHVATWRQWTQAPYRYWKLIFTGLGLSTEIYHAALCRYEPLPFLDDGADPDIMQAEGSHLISQSGYYMGSYQQRAMRALSLDFGQVTEAQYEIFQRWADACVKTMRAFFYVPDTGSDACLLGWLDPKYKFSAPYKRGLRSMGKIPFNARVI